MFVYMFAIFSKFPKNKKKQRKKTKYDAVRDKHELMRFARYSKYLSRAIKFKLVIL